MPLLCVLYLLVVFVFSTCAQQEIIFLCTCLHLLACELREGTALGIYFSRGIAFDKIGHFQPYVLNYNIDDEILHKQNHHGSISMLWLFGVWLALPCNWSPFVQLTQSRALSLHLCLSILVIIRRWNFWSEKGNSSGSPWITMAQLQCFGFLELGFVLPCNWSPFVQLLTQSRAFSHVKCDLLQIMTLYRVCPCVEL